MKRIILISIGIYALTNSVFAQPYYVKDYGSTNYDRCYSIAANGNDVVQVGTSRGYSSTPGDVYWIKTNQLGVITGSYYVNLGGDDCANSVQYNSTNNNWITTGFTTRLDSDSCSRDAFLMASNNFGIPLWMVRYGDKKIEDVGQSVIVTSDKGYLVAGYTAFTCDSDSLQCRRHNVLLFKTDWSGNLIWSKSIDIAGREDYGMKVIETSIGYYIVGYSYGNSNDEPFLMSVSTGGVVNWVGFYGSKGDDRAYSLVDDYPWITIVGNSYGFDPNGQSDILVIQTDFGGLEMWKAVYNTTRNSQSASFGRDILRRDNGYIIAGYADDISSANDYDVDFLVIDPAGVKLTETNIGTGRDERGYGIVSTPNGFKITGYSTTWSYGLDDAILVNCPINGAVGNCYVDDTIPEQYKSGSVFPSFRSCDYMYSDTDSVFYQDAYFQRLVCGNDSDTLPHRIGKYEIENDISLRANIIHSGDPLNLIVASSSTDDIELSIWSSEGRLISTTRHSIRRGSDELQVDIDVLRAGTYFLRVSGDRFSKSIRFVKVE